MDASHDVPPIAFPFADPPAHGEAVEVADGVLWTRLPLPMALDHVNLYALDDGAEGWTLVDTGLDWARGRAALEAFRATLGARPIHRVILTHHHPDHVGLAGWLVAEGATLWASRIAWLTARMLVLDRNETPTPEQVAFRRRAGVTGAALEAWRAERPFNFADCVAPLPLGFRALSDGDRLRAGGRDWRVVLGEGHAPAQVTLWDAGGGLALVADQVLPGISPNIGVYATEPEADPLAGWIATCRRLAEGLEGRDPLLLPGHQAPFTGGARRLAQLIENHETALDRVLAALAEGPASAQELFPALYRRAIGAREHGLALVEAVAHVNHLAGLGRIRATEREDGALAWSLQPPG
ncbi:MAG: MBL fold metallo-hydrolase [Pseudomonadota bacterium]